MAEPVTWAAKKKNTNKLVAFWIWLIPARGLTVDLRRWKRRKQTDLANWKNHCLTHTYQYYRAGHWVVERCCCSVLYQASPHYSLSMRYSNIFIPSYLSSPRLKIFWNLMTKNQCFPVSKWRHVEAYCSKLQNQVQSTVLYGILNVHFWDAISRLTVLPYAGKSRIKKVKQYSVSPFSTPSSCI